MRNAASAPVVTACGASLLSLGAIQWTQFYGWALFAGIPFAVGFATTALLASHRPYSFKASFWLSNASAALVAVLFLAAGQEGFICLLMGLPLFMPFIAVGAYVSWQLFHKRDLQRPGTTTTMLFALLATAIACEPGLRDEKRPIYVVADSMIIDGTADELWQTIVSLNDVPPPDDLFFRAGIATPQKTKIVTCATGGLRVCTMSTGTLVERIDAWEPGRRLGWRALSTPPPMKELNPFHDVDPPHLHGTYRNVRGEFALERVDATRTRVTRRTWYEHDLYPSLYWRIWCDFGASKIHHLVLEHVRNETIQRRGGKQI